MPLTTPSPINVSLYKTGQIGAPFCEKCHLRMPRRRCCSRLLTRCLGRVSEHSVHGDIVLFGAGEREQACSVVRRTFLRAETVSSPQLRKELRFLKAGRTEPGGRGAGAFSICSPGDKHPYTLTAGLRERDPLTNVPASLQEFWEKLERPF